MKRPSYELEVRVDGRTTPPTEVDCHYQREPFPGGHIFELDVSSDKMTKLFPNIQLGEYKEPNWEMSRSIFWSIEALLSSYQSDSDAGGLSKVKFVMNSIREFRLTEDEAAITGVCSPLVIMKRNP